MDAGTLLFLVLAGGGAGFVAGFFGVGGGIILVPILLYFYSSMMDVSSLVATHLALGTSLFVVILTSLSSASRHYRNGHVIVRAALLIGIISILSAFAGAQVAAVLSGRTLEQLFSVVLAVAAIRLLGKQRANGEKQEIVLRPPAVILTGLVTGGVSSLTGVGGGVVSIPLMHGLMRLPMKKAIGTSSAAIVLTAASAAAGYLFSGLSDPGLERYSNFTVGYIDYIHSLPLIAGTVPCAVLGASLAHRMRTSVLTRLFAVLMLIVAVRMFFG
ncbi:MAG: sulfite exporter TauE/SafE family protein [Ignavibacteria bacterium]|nr:sulfite exporter TauE/SafE family protein [Ignavibacteria bacterium]